MNDFPPLSPSRHGAGGAPDRSGRRPTARGSRGLSWLWYLVSIALLVGAWQLAIIVTATPDYLLPTPEQVVGAFRTYDIVLIEQAWVTTREILVAFVVSVLLGSVLAVPIAFSRPVRRLAYPLLVMSQAVPKVALGPLFIVWFGFGPRTNVLIAVSVAIFPIIVNSAFGLGSIDPDLVRLGRSMGSSRWRLFRLVRLPAALPGMFAGVKVAVTLAVIGAVVGEFMVGGSGLGYLTLSAAGNQNVPLLFACVITLAFVGILAFAAVELLERVVLRRHPPQHRF